MLRTVRPLGYSIPMDGPVGAMVDSSAHGLRPSRIRFLVGASVIVNWSPRSICATTPSLADDVVFGSSGDLAVDVVANDPESDQGDAEHPL